MSDIAIRVEGLGKSYQIRHQRSGYRTLRDDLVNLLPGRRQGGESKETFWALRDINFEVKTGEVLGIIGRNGAGKSTLLKILARITKPTTGYADIFGRVGSLLEVGTGFHPELTGRENIFLSGTILGMRRHEIQRKFDEIVDFAEVEQFLDTPVKRFSSGMYTRLAFSVAAHLDPEILIVDEVLAVGDVKFQEKSLGKMGDVARSGRTVLFVSHNMAAIRNLCNRGILLDMGKLLLNETASKVVDHYLDRKANVFKSYFKTVPLAQRSINITNVEVNADAPQDILSSQICHIEYVVYHKIGAVIAIKVTNNLGVVIFTSIDTDMDTQLFVKEPGKYRIYFKLPSNILSSGIYNITVSVSDMKAERFQYLEDIVQFEVIQNSQIQNSFLSREGVIVLPNNSRVEKLEEGR